MDNGHRAFPASSPAGENWCLHKEVLPPIIVICCPKPWNICCLAAIDLYNKFRGSFPSRLSHHRAIEKPYKVQPLEPVGGRCPAARSSSNDSLGWWINPIRGRGDITLLATPPTDPSQNQPTRQGARLMIPNVTEEVDALQTFLASFQFYQKFYQKCPFHKHKAVLGQFPPLRWFSRASPWISGQGECPKKCLQIEIEG